MVEAKRIIIRKNAAKINLIVFFLSTMISTRINFYIIIPQTIVKFNLYIYKSTQKKSRPHLNNRDVGGIFIQSACFQLIFQHTLNFLLHILLCGFREMCGHNIRCLSDFHDKGRTVLCVCCIVHTFFLLKSPTRIKAFCVGNGLVQPAQKDFENYSCRAKCYCLLFL